MKPQNQKNKQFLTLCTALYVMLYTKRKSGELSSPQIFLEGLFMALYAADNDVKSAEHSPDSLSQSFAVRKPGLSLLARFLKLYNGGGGVREEGANANRN
jgi:hypothetical protein